MNDRLLFEHLVPGFFGPINSGEVLYINSFPTVTDVIQPKFLDEASRVLGLNESVQTINVLPVYNSAYGGVKITGDLKIDTNGLILQGSSNFADLPFPINQSSDLQIYGKITLTLKNSTFSISPSESSLLIRPENDPIEGEIVIDNPENASIISGADTVYGFAIPASIRFNTTGVSIFTLMPSITASGTTVFDQLDVHSSIYVPLNGMVQQPAKIIGVVKFDTMFITNPIILFSSFHADGTIINLAAASKASLPLIPWIEILISPYNLAFNTLFLLGIVLYIVKKKRIKVTINIKSSRNSSN